VNQPVLEREQHQPLVGVLYNPSLTGIHNKSDKL